MAVLTESTLSNSPGLTGITRNAEGENLYPVFSRMVAEYLADGQTAVGRLFMSPGEAFPGGQKYVFAVGTRNPQSVGSRFEGGLLPLSDTRDVRQLEILPRKMLARLRFTPEAKDDTSGSTGAFSRAEVAAMEGLLKQYEIKKYRTAMYGRAEVLGQIAAAPTAGSATSRDITIVGRDQRSYTAGAFFARGLLDDRASLIEGEPFYVGQQVAFIAAASGALGSPLSNAAVFVNGANDAESTTAVAIVNSLNGANVDTPTVNVRRADNGAFDLASFAGGVAGMNQGWIYEYGSRRSSINVDATQAISEFAGHEGLGSLIGGSTIYSAVYGVTRTSIPGLESYVNFGATKQVLTPDVLTLAQQRLVYRAGQAAPLCFLTHACWAAYSKPFEGRQRFESVIGRAPGTTETGNTPIGYKHITSAGEITFATDIMAIPSAAPLVNPAGFEYHTAKPFMVAPERWIADRDSTEVYMGERGNLRAIKPMEHAWIDNVLESSFSVPIV
jgi:hypothetical protein